VRIQCVYQQRKKHYVEGGYRLDPVRVISVEKLGLLEGVRVVGIVACMVPVEKANANGLFCEKKKKRLWTLHRPFPTIVDFDITD
jgi:hypothetical protein